MIEIWKDVDGYKGAYMVSNKGRVKSLDRKVFCALNGLRSVKGRMLKPYQRKRKERDGYLVVSLVNNNKRKMSSVHNLVWEAFNCKKPKGMQIDHVDENKFNNDISNLQLLSCVENVTKYHQSRTDTSSKYTGVSKHSKSKKWVAQIGTKYIGLFHTEIEASEAYQKELKKKYK